MKMRGAEQSESSAASMSVLALHGCAADTLALSAYLTRYDTHVIHGKPVGGKEFDEEDAKKACTYVVSNKYFTADLDIRRVVYGAADTALSVTSSSGYEGFVLVVSQEHAESKMPGIGANFTAVQSDALLAAAFSAAEDEDVSVRLAVVLSPSSGDGLEGLGMPAREAWVSWCCDHSFEFVEIFTGTPAALSDTHNEREKDGLPRVVEALSSHMWRSMQRKGGDGLASSSAAQASGTAASPSVAGQPSSPQSAAPVAAPAAVAQDDKGDSNANPFLAELLASNKEEKDEEASLFSMVDQAKALRAAVDAGTVSDEQRKAQAEAIATRFAAMLDMQGSSDDDDDDNSD